MPHHFHCRTDSTCNFAAVRCLYVEGITRGEGWHAVQTLNP